MLDEIKIQPLFAKPLAFTKISIHESDIQIIKDLEYTNGEKLSQMTEGQLGDLYY